MNDSTATCEEPRRKTGTPPGAPLVVLPRLNGRMQDAWVVGNQSRRKFALALDDDNPQYLDRVFNGCATVTAKNLWVVASVAAMVGGVARDQAIEGHELPEIPTEQTLRDLRRLGRLSQTPYQKAWCERRIAEIEGRR